MTGLCGCLQFGGGQLKHLRSARHRALIAVMVEARRRTSRKRSLRWQREAKNTAATH